MMFKDFLQSRYLPPPGWKAGAIGFGANCDLPAPPVPPAVAAATSAAGAGGSGGVAGFVATRDRGTTCDLEGLSTWGHF
ncbi:hypothetical protein N7481_009932 [Penicillium waksmanii]|uniref:uncharacterized protein n=1 Tax=Penicillium waksmanii TaxID=69791 RepID=UPI002547BB3E|nr:uncharacterized protein N7481_009932 [Penicillium waksmanii]KAJ5976225.1 hypothetical protein N7481_009932 [Penicillium waksmanii]